MKVSTATRPVSADVHALLLVPDGVGVRNFLLGPFLEQASERLSLSVLHAMPRESLRRLGPGLKLPQRSQALLPSAPDPVLSLVRKTLAYSHLWWGDTRSMRASRKRPVAGPWSRRTLEKTTRLLARAAAFPAGIENLDRLHRWLAARRTEVEQYRGLFSEWRPSVLFCSHQRPLSVLPPVLAARDLGIPTATFVFSWDNLTSKARIAAPFDYYLVWSDLMRRELLDFYPSVAPERVRVVGTPQFDAGPREPSTREDFFRRVGADSSRPLICYSGGDAGTCPEDPQHVAILLDLVRDGRIAGKPQVLLRPSPVDDGRRYDPVRGRYPELLYAEPRWIHDGSGDWSRVVPLPEDVAFLADLVRHSDLNVNVASTMTLDFAVRDKPVVNVAFDVADPPPFAVPLWEHYYRFEHYRPVVELGAARFARSAEELARHVNAYLADPALDRDARRRLVELEIGVPPEDSSERILDVLEEIGA
jgi:hypothetical protein